MWVTHWLVVTPFHVNVYHLNSVCHSPPTSLCSFYKKHAITLPAAKSFPVPHHTSCLVPCFIPHWFSFLVVLFPPSHLLLHLCVSLWHFSEPVFCMTPPTYTHSHTPMFGSHIGVLLNQHLYTLHCLPSCPWSLCGILLLFISLFCPCSIE